MSAESGLGKRRSLRAKVQPLSLGPSSPARDKRVSGQTPSRRARRPSDSYNGLLLFKPHFSESLKLDGDPFTRILSDLDPEGSVYKFDAISVELLGRIYESFPGHCIQINKRGRREVVPRPRIGGSGGAWRGARSPRELTERPYSDV